MMTTNSKLWKSAKIHAHDNNNYIDDPEITIIANNIEQQSGEDILEIASELFYSVNHSVKVVAAKNQE